MDRRVFIFQTLLMTLALVELKGLVLGQLQMDIPTPVVYVNLNEPVEINCSVRPDAINSNTEPKCIWGKVSEDNKPRTVISFIEALNSKLKVQASKDLGNMTLDDEDISKGICKIKFSSATEEHLGKWKCSYFERRIWVGYVEVLQYEAPVPPGLSSASSFSSTEPIVVANENSSITCCTYGGRPLDRTKIRMKYKGKPLERVSLVTCQPQNCTCMKWDHIFKEDEDKSEVECEIDHPAFNTGVLPNHRSVAKPVLVAYPPKLVKHTDSYIYTTTSYLGDETIIEFEASGNPPPVIDAVIPLNDSFAADKIYYSSNITSRTTEKLLIRLLNVSETLQIRITVKNYVGNDTGIAVVEFSEAGMNSSYKSTYWTLVILGIIAAVGLIIAMVSIFSKRNGWLCYSNRTQLYPVTIKPK